MKKIPTCIKCFYIVLAISLFVVVGAAVKTSGDFDENAFTGYDVESFSDGWTDSDGRPLEIPGNYDIGQGEELSFSKVLETDTESDTCIMFRTDHTFVTAYINDELIYSFGKAEEIPIGNTPGSGWQLIPIRNAEAGDVIRIVTSCPYKKYSGDIREIITGTKAELVSYIMWKGMPLLVLIAIPFLIGVFVILVPPFFFRGYPIMSFLNAGLSFVIISAWSFTEARSWQLYFENPYVMQTVSFLMFALIVPAILLAMHSMGLVGNEKLFRRAMFADTLTPLFVIILQLLNIVDFFNTLILIHIMILANAFTFAASYMREVRSDRGMSRVLSICLYSTIAACAVLDLLDFYVLDRFGNGFFTRLELFALLIASGLVAIKRALIIHSENVEKKAYEKMAYTDNLTGFRNRRAFDRDIEQLENDKKEVRILYMDMNGLKCINDNKGHYMGDKALITISEQIATLQSEGSLCYRLGGDEFCVLSCDMDIEELEEKCTGINQRLREYNDDFGYPISISYGMESYVPGGELTLNKCIYSADRKMYEYKEEVYRHQKKYR